MKGLEILVTNSDLVLKQEERLVKLLVMFKDKKYGTKYIVFTSGDNKELYYGSPLVNGKKMVIMKFKNIKDAEMVKEFVWNFLNNQSITNFEILTMPEIEKLEIIDNNTLDVKEEYIDKLIDIFFKKEEIKIQGQQEIPKKKSKLPLLLTLIIILGLVFGFLYLKNNPELIYGKNTYMECKINYNIDDLGVSSKEVITLTFSNSQILKQHEKEISYVFGDNDIFYDFKEKNLQYKYLNETGLEKFDDDTLTYTLYINYDLVNDYKLPRDYEELVNYYKNNGYSCNNTTK